MLLKSRPNVHLQGFRISVEKLKITVNCLHYRYPFLQSRLKQNPGRSKYRVGKNVFPGGVILY